MSDNRGAQALRRVLEQTTQKELADKTNLSQSHISRLSRGELPKLREDAVALEREAGIEVTWWDQAPEPETEQPGAA